MPKFWRTVRKIAVRLGTAALAVIIADRTWNLGLDANLISVCSYIVGACAGMGLSAQLTTTLPDKQNDQSQTPQQS